MNKFERWCARNEHRGIPHLIWYVIGGQALVFILQSTTLGRAFVYDWLTLMPSRILRGEVWRLVTFALTPWFGSVINALLSFVFYYFVGTALERAWGKMKFTVYYLSGMLMLTLFCMLLGIWFGDDVRYLANTHWLNMSLFLAYAVLNPESYVRLYFLIPVKIKWIAIVDGVYLLVNVFLTPFPGGLAPLAALTNFLCYFAGDFLRLFRRTRFESKNRIDFRQKTRELQQKQKARGYRHRCTVCGRTDVTNPELEFRYCSLCKGYPCYCEEHIFSHVHIE